MTKGMLAAKFAVLVIFVLYAFPLLLILLASFKSDTAIVNDPAGLIFHPNLDAYRSVFNTQLFMGMRNSFFIAGGTMLLALVAATPLAYALARTSARWSGLVIGVLIALQMTPAATAIIPQFQIIGQLKLLNSIPGVILAEAAGVLPYATLILRPFYLSIPDEVEEAAYIDGAGRFRTFAVIVFPLVRNGVSLVGVLLFIGAWGDFLYPVSFLTDSSKFPMSVLLLLQQGFYGTQWNSLMALALLGAIPTIVIFAFVARRLTSGLALGIGK